MSKTTSPKKPKQGLVKCRFTGKREILPVLPDAPPGKKGKTVRNDARTLLACAAEHAEHYQLHKEQWRAQTGLSRDRFAAAYSFLAQHGFAGLCTVMDNDGLHGSVYVIDLNGQVDTSGFVRHYGADPDHRSDRKEVRNLICRKRSGCLDPTMPDLVSLDEEQGLPESVASERLPHTPYNDELISEGKEEPLTPAEQGDVSSFEENQTTDLPEELLAQVDEIMVETQDIITTPEARQGLPLSPAEEETLLARHRGFLLAEAREEGEAYPCVTNTDDARLLREAYRKYGLSSFPGQAQLALDSDANRATRPVHFLMTSLRLRAYPDFNPAFAELGLWQEPSGLSDAWLLGKVAIEKLKARRKSTGKHLRGADAHNWLQHSLPGRLILATLAPDQELSDKVAHDLCRQFARERESLTLEKAARFWMLRLGMRRPILVDRLCEFIHAALKEDDVYDPLLGITEERMRAYCGVELMPPSGRPDWRAALTFDNYGSGFQDGWDMADLMHGLTRVSKRAVVWREDVHDGDRAALLQVLVLRQQMPDGSLTAQRIDELLVQIGHSQNRYQRWLVETPRGRNTFVSAVKSGLVPAELLQAAVGMDGIEHTDRVRLLAAMCEASISALCGSKL